MAERKFTGKSAINIRKFIPREKYGGITWEFHPSDDDCWPSIPHGHSVDLKRPVKLDVFTGIIYDVDTRERVGKLAKKDLRRLHNLPGFIECFDKANEYFKEKFPKVYAGEGYPKELPYRRLSQTRELRKIIKRDNYDFYLLVHIPTFRHRFITSRYLTARGRARLRYNHYIKQQ